MRHLQVAAVTVCLCPSLFAAGADKASGAQGETPAAEAVLPEELSSLRAALEGTYGWSEETAFARFRRYVGQDYRTFYSRANCGLIVLGIGAAQVTMGTGADQGISNWYQDHVDGQDADEVAEVIKQAGTPEFVLPAYLLLGALSPLAEDVPVADVACDWGANCLRTALVGEIPMLLLQQLLGSSRPRDGDRRKVHWKPFQDNNGVSGHAFLGAIPALNAAYMADRWYWKSLFGVLSAGPAWAQLQHDAHTLSQVSLGWWLAWLSTRSVHRTNAHPGIGQIAPFVHGDAVGLAFHGTF
jgi:hypothetical protein